MACKSPQLTILLCMILWIINSVEGRHTGIKIEDVKYCGPPDKTWKLKVTPWPVITSGSRYNITVTFTPVVDVLSTSAYFEYEYDGRRIKVYNENVCPSFPKLCNLPANETCTLTFSRILGSVPPGLKGSFILTVELRNQGMVLWLCLKLFVTLIV
ncbi:hypothetical protein OS493_016871 [Desmophyllum pertusum]|uniref:MD-2-related lipid-recognition domain-containing protein n=1 Tax=Desmophyllum pertusum TaxID=174260 RepID=A0A9W9YNS4_9CNID|nr:hypothetical protein OS493_016871 [Desmophyllum pertusum]